MRFPIVLFCYNRPTHLERTLAALGSNQQVDEFDLIVYSDGPRRVSDQPAVAAVRRVLRSPLPFRSVAVHASGENHGLAESIITGVGEVLATRKAAIVLEDDLLTAPGFLCYMDLALKTYAPNARIMSVSGYTAPAVTTSLPADYVLPVYLSPRNSSWGWGTWRDRWSRVDWQCPGWREALRDQYLRRTLWSIGQDVPELLSQALTGVVDSWAVRFTYAHFLDCAYSVCPVRSLVQNIGLDYSGTHTARSPRHVHSDLTNALPSSLPSDVAPDLRILRTLNLSSRVAVGRAIVKRLVRPALPGFRRVRRYIHRMVYREQGS